MLTCSKQRKRKRFSLVGCVPSKQRWIYFDITIRCAALFIFIVEQNCELVLQKERSYWGYNNENTRNWGAINQSSPKFYHSASLAPDLRCSRVPLSYLSKYVRGHKITTYPGGHTKYRRVPRYFSFSSPRGGALSTPRNANGGSPAVGKIPHNQLISPSPSPPLPRPFTHFTLSLSLSLF